jgi:hypothetical protein
MPAASKLLIGRLGQALDVKLLANGVQQIAERYTQRQA